MNIALIGMPGSGKSFVGKLLAETLGYKFIETDRLIEAKLGQPLQNILDSLGDEAFLDEESRTIQAALKGLDSAVISPGGSAVYHEETMRACKEVSTIVYLRVPIETLVRRIGGVPRGIVRAKGRDFQTLFDERTPLYENAAHVAVDGDHDAHVVVQDIRSSIGL